jgi:hypothetical protein
VGGTRRTLHPWCLEPYHQGLDLAAIDAIGPHHKTADLVAEELLQVRLEGRLRGLFHDTYPSAAAWTLGGPICFI